MIHEVIRRMINTLVSDLIVTSQANIQSQNPSTVDDVRKAGKPLISLSESVASENTELKRFLNKNLYKHPKVEKMSEEAKLTIRHLFDGFMTSPKLLPEEAQKNIGQQIDAQGRARVIADYIAGMTDRFATSEVGRIT